jgi:hypothetical protein
MTRLLVPAVACAAWILIAPGARAQVVPFFNQQAALFDPEISTLTTGVLSDVQATVSADRKYVTLNMRASNSTLLALREFTFQTGSTVGLPTGFVGMPVVPPRGGNNNGAGGNVRGAAQQGEGDAAAAAAARPSILSKEGMTLVGRADVAGAGHPSRTRAGAP